MVRIVPDRRHDPSREVGATAAIHELEQLMQVDAVLPRQPFSDYGRKAGTQQPLDAPLQPSRPLAGAIGSAAG